MNKTKIIQWNCRGFKANFNEIELLMQTHTPTVFALQETHLKESDNVNLKSYDI